MLKLTVFFDDPFWVGVFERTDNDKLQTAKVLFGAEPKDGEVWEYVLSEYARLDFSRPFEAEGTQERKINPKRLQRVIHEQTKEIGVGTKAQQALQKERELRKVERRAETKEQREHERDERFAQKQMKKKEKHKGH